MTRPPTAARRSLDRIVRNLARAWRALLRRPPATPAAGPRPAVPPLRAELRRELQRLEREAFPLWRPDPDRVRALQLHGA